MNEQDAKELLKSKQKLDEQKQEFASFAHQVMNTGETEAGQEFSNDRVPDEQNRLKDQENRMM